MVFDLIFFFFFFGFLFDIQYFILDVFWFGMGLDGGILTD